MRMDESLAIHPGEILDREFMRPLRLSSAALAEKTRMPAPLLDDLIGCRRPMDAEAALRLSAYFGTTPNFWMSIQNRYDLDKAAESGLSARIASEVQRPSEGA